MVDALVSGASVERRAGSSPVLGTIHKENVTAVTFSFLYPNSNPNDRIGLYIWSEAKLFDVRHTTTNQPRRG